MATCIGDDGLGREILRCLRHAGSDDRAVAVNPSKPTGTVTVELDANGKPTFIMHENVAWDVIPSNGALSELASMTDAVCSGSLAQWVEVLRETIRQFLEMTEPGCLRICNVNLRQSYFSQEALVDSFQAGSENPSRR